ncbi:MAG: DUF4321 domain-containing protein [Candidatus Marinimicrobia bacterium]|nr:DUF4321 domain-containing protein [Candidatus Neomarinimicrobiota bacterium]MBL7022912.1 DUF4321 domain-containing protein [Candidatus Neomarinimicrobiota bacterium]MBL7109231.1 DUF4321 domain-containing protein [Candidatus Neomarinimicrobiota bacterium]
MSIPVPKRSLFFIFLVILVGAILGTVFSQMAGQLIPEGVVRDFFLTSKPLGWDPFTLNLQLFTITTGFSIDISVVSILGIAVAWYFLRFFR